MDSKNFLYLPRWVKIISISVLVFSLILGVVIAVYFAARQDKSDYVLIGMSLAQTSASGLLLALVVFFSEKDNSIKLLIKKTKHFLKKEIPHGLQRIVSRIANKEVHLQIIDDNTSDILQRYLLKMDNDSFTFSIIYNVRRLILVISISGVTDVQDKLKNSIIGSEHVGFDVSFKNEENQTLIYFRKNLDKNILEDNSERLFWINDISLLLRDILINLFLRS